MMNEEKYLEERLSKKNPFQVPEGYFDSFTEQVMRQIPERQQGTRRMLLRPWMYAAACLVAIVFSVALYFSKIAPDAPELPQVVVTESYIDEAADYAMIDNTDIYACLAEN